MRERRPILNLAKALKFSSVAFLLLGWSLQGGAAAVPGELPLLTNALQVHQLERNEANRGYPVRVRGVVTFYDARIPELFIQDETDGVFIRIDTFKPKPGFQFAVGQVLEVSGKSVKGGFGPDIAPKEISPQGTGPLPAPREVTFRDMAAGSQTCRWVRFRGIVRSFGLEGFTEMLSLELDADGGRVVVPIQQFDRQRARALIDAEIQVTGVSATHFNRKGQLIRVAVQLSSMAGIVVLKPAPDPPAIPASKINSLLTYAPEGEYGHRVKVQGVVTLHQPGQALFITDEGEGLRIQTIPMMDTTQVQPGDRVEVLGFPLPCEYVSPVLQDAEFRKLGTGPPPAPIRIPPEEGFKDKYDATLVQMEATLLSRSVSERNEILELQARDFVFRAELRKPAAKGDPVASIPNDSRVRLTGICLVPVDPYRLAQSPQSFSLLLRSPADVVLLERPSWWTVEHTLWLLAGTLAVFCASLAWVAVLRKQVKAQTAIIRQKAQREAALEERTRIARDLHDDLGAGLTQIAFLSQVAQKESQCSRPVKEHLQEISGSAQDAFQALDEIVWVVNPGNDTIENLTNYVCHFAEAFFRGTPTRCRLDLPTNLPDREISTEIRNNVFYAMKEALHNVRKHADASEVCLGVQMEGGFFSIRIEDNGRGFVPENARPQGNGLRNMRQRLEKIGGEFALESRCQGGTTIRIRVPLQNGPDRRASPI